MAEVEGVSNVLLDIEALPGVLAKQWDDATFRPYRDAFPEEHRVSPAALEAHVKDLTRRDVKIAYLKNLQGHLWEEGYRSGAYSTPLFPDVVPQLEGWKAAGTKLAIYSSGSVFAQKLLFQHVSVDETVASGEGSAGEDASQPPGTEDMRSLMTEDGWFDTTNAGLKTEASSYSKIVETLKWQPARTLFLTDNVKEYDAAAEAGLRVILLDRPGNATVSEADRARMEVVGSLDEITLTSQREVVAGALPPELDGVH
ncbi:enolase-phosphatase E1 [Teratosphaeriaceae sp. CCFEE 6253]|nr:enolase-phosphatase E1 [Teratosphaeriaceae sp. CCFEE 6253]